MIAYANSFAKELDHATFYVFSNHLYLSQKGESYLEKCSESDNGFEYVPVDKVTMSEGIMPEMSGTEECSIVYPDGTREIFSGQAVDVPPHEHIFQNANLKCHLKNGDGSCRLSTYAARVCETCGKMLTNSDWMQENIAYECNHV